MIVIYERILIGNLSDCRRGSTDLAVVHACKHPCHVNAVGYSGNLHRTHPNYLTLVDEFDLYLNIIDPDRPLFMPPLFTEFLAFGISNWDAGRSLLIHCNQGESRAPSLALLLIAKHIGEISNESYRAAKDDFYSLYPSYNPGLGIQEYLSDQWNELDQ